MHQSTVYFDSLTNVKWSETPFFDRPKNTIDIWKITNVPGPELINSLALLLSSEEQKRAHRYLHKKDEIRFITSRAVLKILIGKYLQREPSEIEFIPGTNKKPFLKNNETTGLFYNISHSDNFILIGIANSEIGVDIEKIDPSFDYVGILASVFSREEIAFIKNNPISERNAFYRLWTRKEALAKATAKGLPDDLTLLPCLNGNHLLNNEMGNASASWIVSSIEIENQCVMSFAYPAETENLRFFTFDPGEL